VGSDKSTSLKGGGTIRQGADFEEENHRLWEGICGEYVPSLESNQFEKERRDAERGEMVLKIGLCVKRLIGEGERRRIRERSARAYICIEERDRTLPSGGKSGERQLRAFREVGQVTASKGCDTERRKGEFASSEKKKGRRLGKGGLRE